MDVLCVLSYSAWPIYKYNIHNFHYVPFLDIIDYYRYFSALLTFFYLNSKRSVFSHPLVSIVERFTLLKKHEMFAEWQEKIINRISLQPGAWNIGMKLCKVYLLFSNCHAIERIYCIWHTLVSWPSPSMGMSPVSRHSWKEEKNKLYSIWHRCR